MLRDMAACGKTRTDSHCCRNLHRLIHRTSKTVAVNISTVTAPVRLSKRGKKKKSAMVQYPILRVSDWARCIFNLGGHFFLGGQNMDSLEAFGDTLELFWSRYSKIDPDLPFFRDSYDWRFAIPYCLHGDEGRGANKRPVMVISFQPLITSADMKTSNMSGKPG